MKKRFLSLMLVLAMIVGVLSPLTTFADNTSEPAKPGATHKTTVNIHKVLMNEHNWSARKVTVKKNEVDETKYIYSKTEKGETKYYDASNNTEITDQDYINAFATAKEVFPGWSGLDGTEFKGQKLDIGKYFGNDSKAINGVAFRIYEVKNTAEAGYTKGDQLITDHKLATNDLDANKYYKLVKFDSTNNINKEQEKNTQEYILSKTVNGENGIAQVTLPDGTYRVVEDKQNSTYKGDKGETLTSMKAVPFDLVLPVAKPDGTGNYSEADPLNLYPKNTEKLVKFDKNFAKKNGLEKITDPNTLKDVGAVMDNYEKEKANAQAHIGKEVPYEAKAELPKGSVFKDLDLADSMDNGLEYDATKGVTITVTPQVDLTADTDYKVETVGNGFKVHFNQTGLDKLNKKAEETDVSITFTYSAKVTAAAVVDKPMDNHATFTFNHKPPKPSSEKLKPVNKEIKVKKDWADGTAPTDIKVKYVLLDENDKALADITFDGANKVIDDEDKNQITDLGHGFKFKRTGDFAGTFQGLDENKQYKVKEIVNGYEPEYTIETATGTVTVKNTKTTTSITPTPPQVTVGGKKFVKTDAKTNRLAGAEFVIQDQNKVTKEQGKEENGPNFGKYLKVTSTNSTAYDTAEKAYNDAIAAVNASLAKGEISATNKVTIGKKEFTTKDTAMAEVKSLQKTRDEEFVKAKLAYTWVDSKDDATKFYSNGDGQFEVTGLEYGHYRAVETKAPAGGYALPTDGGNFAFEVNKGSYNGASTEFKYEVKVDTTKGEKQTYGMKIENTKVTIPQTGGIGTIIFTAIGLAIMASAVIAIKKRQATEAR